MFTGLIEEIGVVKSLTRIAVGKLVVSSGKLIEEVAVGDSVSVSGVCLTVTSIGNGELCFDVVPETLARSALSGLQAGDRVNLEASVRAGKMMGGHFVQGHVDGVGKIESIKSVGESWMIGVSAPGDVLKYVVEKGSVALDGISLTVASVDDSRFAIAIIPHTLSVTTLHSKKVGDPVNLEADIIGKYVEKFLSDRADSRGVSEDTLRKAGFV